MRVPGVAVIQISLRVKNVTRGNGFEVADVGDGPYVKNRKESGIDEPIHPSEKNKEKIVMIQSRRRHRFKTSHPIPLTW